MKRAAIILLSGLFSFLMLSRTAMAQNEVQRQRDSLNGLSEVGLVVNIEKPENLQAINLSATQLKQQLVKELSSLPLRIVSDVELQENENIPILHLHINIMEGAPGLYPYSAILNCYQPVKLILNDDLSTMAITWTADFVGVVSADYASFIAEESVGLADVFKNDYRIINN